MNRREFLLSAASLAFIGGCRHFVPENVPAPALPPMLPPVPPLDATVVAEIRRQIAAGYFTCACVGAAGGGRGAFGNRRPLETVPVPVAADSLFEIASVSKTHLALIMALMRHEGKLDIDAPFTKYLPDHVLAKEGTKIRIRDLAAHCSGFTNGWMGKVGIYGKPWPYKSDAEYERAALSVRPVNRCREKYVYACQNMILMGFIVERVLGLDLDAAAKQYVWGPLGMKSTGWTNRVGDPKTVQMFTGGPLDLGTKGDQNAHNVVKPIGNAGVFSTLDDLMLYAEDLLERKTFPKDVYDLLFTTEFADGKGHFRSFGWDMTPATCPPGWSASTINHSGYTGQYVALDPVAHRGSVVLTNLRLSRPAERGRAYAERRALAAMLG